MVSSNNLHKQFHEVSSIIIALKILYHTTIQPDYDVSPAFYSYQSENIKHLIARCYTLLRDPKDKQYNTFSLKIFVQNLQTTLKRQAELTEKWLERIQEIDNVTREIDGSKQNPYAYVRDKLMAHTELNNNNEVRNWGEAQIKLEDVNHLYNTLIKIYEEIWLQIYDTSGSLAQEQIEKLSTIMWDAYEKAGIVKKRKL